MWSSICHGGVMMVIASQQRALTWPGDFTPLSCPDNRLTLHPGLLSVRSGCWTCHNLAIVRSSLKCPAQCPVVGPAGGRVIFDLCLWHPSSESCRSQSGATWPHYTSHLSNNIPKVYGHQLTRCPFPATMLRLVTRDMNYLKRTDS